MEICLYFDILCISGSPRYFASTFADNSGGSWCFLIGYHEGGVGCVGVLFLMFSCRLYSLSAQQVCSNDNFTASAEVCCAFDPLLRRVRCVLCSVLSLFSFPFLHECLPSVCYFISLFVGSTMMRHVPSMQHQRGLAWFINKPSLSTRLNNKWWIVCLVMNKKVCLRCCTKVVFGFRSYCFACHLHLSWRRIKHHNNIATRPLPDRVTAHNDLLLMTNFSGIGQATNDKNCYHYSDTNAFVHTFTLMPSLWQHHLARHDAESPILVARFRALTLSWLLRFCE